MLRARLGKVVHTVKRAGTYAAKVPHTEYTELQPLLSGVHSVMEVKSVLAGEGGGVHAHPLSLHLPSPVKLQCTLQLSGQIHCPCSSLPIYVLCGPTTRITQNRGTCPGCGRVCQRSLALLQQEPG
jgi:hypothetical protein